MLLFSDPERTVNDSFIFLESSGNQCQDGIKHLQQLPHFYFLGGTQMLIHILQRVKACGKPDLKFLKH
jgi:hypothetical protein